MNRYSGKGLLHDKGYGTANWKKIRARKKISVEADLDVGLLLPCNVIVYETDDGKAYVAAINPISALEVIQS